MYAREIDGQEFDFGVSGKLIRNVLVMYDRQTDSLWSQLLGESVEGELVGTKLEFVPSWMMTWSEWQAMHPDSVALQKGYRGAQDPYAFGYYGSDDAGVIGETFRDDRLEVKEFVIGVELGETAVAYPYRFLSDEPVVNHSVDGEADGTDLLVVFDKESTGSAVFIREVDGQTLTFAQGGSINELIDAETGSTWDAFSGTAIDGQLAGTKLERVKSTAVFWFGWKDFFPNTLVYGLAG